MTRRVWTPMLEDWAVDSAELARPTSTAPATWEVSLYRGNRGERDTSMAALFGAMATFADHRFVLTIGNLGHFADWQAWAERQVRDLSGYVGQLFLHWAQRVSEHDVFRTDTDAIIRRAWPLPNVTIAAGPITSQVEADRVLPALLAVKAARREAVIAPTSPIDLFRVASTGRDTDRNHIRYTDALHGFTYDGLYHTDEADAYTRHAKLDAVRVRGGNAPMHPKWVRLLRDQAKNAGVPFSLSWGEWAPVAMPNAWFDGSRATAHVSGEVHPATWADVVAAHGDWHGFERWGAARTGCCLDGDDYPEVDL